MFRTRREIAAQAVSVLIIFGIVSCAGLKVIAGNGKLDLCSILTMHSMLRWAEEMQCTKLYGQMDMHIS